jgi:type II secretory ATPase GspE/PulE/Tfp pilus assembly ATPase PilB-like protein
LDVSFGNAILVMSVDATVGYLLVIGATSSGKTWTSENSIISMIAADEAVETVGE